MRYYFAPMEGITGYVFRNTHHEYFPGIDKYFTPFITPKQGKGFCFTTRERNDVQPEHNAGLRIVPQILTNQAEGFLAAAGRLKEYGYEEVNLNLGCPSGTVVSKNKGAGFLASPHALNAFLEEIFEKSPVRISIKTRIGKEDPEEFGPLLEIFNRYPAAELIIHPRLQTDYYKNKPNLEVFEMAQKGSKNPLCYNGDLFTAERLKEFSDRYPAVDTVMIGRGLLVQPGLVSKILSGEMTGKKQLHDFHDTLAERYRETLSCERDVLFKMKELWTYLGFCFSNCEKEVKRIRKAQNLSEYRIAVNELFINGHTA